MEILGLESNHVFTLPTTGVAVTRDLSPPSVSSSLRRISPVAGLFSGLSPVHLFYLDALFYLLQLRRIMFLSTRPAFKYLASSIIHYRKIVYSGVELYAI
jgi:hypothetical protein